MAPEDTPATKRDIRELDERMREMKIELLAGVDERLAGVDERMTAMDERMTGMEKRLLGVCRSELSLNARSAAVGGRRGWLFDTKYYRQ